jgi:outer membrane autotransporter protein
LIAQTAGAGNISISNSSTGVINSLGSVAIYATTSGVGTIEITNSGTITAGSLYGIYADASGTTSGGVTLANTAGGTITSANIGIQGSARAAPLSMTNAGTITAPYAGLVAGNVSGALTVGNSGSIVFGRFGLLAGSALGITTVTNSGTLTQTGTPSTDSSATSGLPPAIRANLPGTGTWGVYAVGGVAPLSLLNDAAGRITAGTGLEGRVYGAAQASSFGFTGPFPASNGPLSIENRGTITATADGMVGRAFGSGAVNLTNSGTISVAAGGRGIVARLQSTNDVAVANSGSVSGGDFGVTVNHLSTTGNSSGAAVPSGATLVTNAAGGRIQGNDTAVDVVTYNGAVTIQNAGTIVGGDRGITANNNYNYRDTTLVPSSFTRATSNLTIENLAGATLSATSDQALRANWAGPVKVNNAGTITGFVAFGPNSSATSVPSGVTGTVAFNNSGTFAARGNSTFNSGNDAVFDNTGTVSLAPTTAATNVTFNGLSTFRNSGTINLVNGFAGDTFTINGNYVGQNGRLLTEFSTQANAGDRLVINGNASGTTGITVTNLTSATAFTTGAPVVVVTGTSDANAFTLTSTRGFGTLEPTLVTTRDGNSNTSVAVAAVPNAVALSAPTAVTASRTIAFQGGTAVLDRVTQLRTDAQRAASGTPSIPQALQYAGLNQYAALVTKDPIAPNLVQPVEPPPSNVRPAVWARAYGDLERRTGSTSFSFAGTSFSRDLGYTQSGGGLLGGADLVISRLTSAEDGLIIGVMGGYTTAAVRLNQAAGRQDYEGGTVGVYGSYLNGPWFWDHLFKVDLLGLDIRAPGLLQRTGLQNYAYTTNVGYRIPLQNAVYVEPTAGLEYVATSFNQQAALTPTSVPLRDGDALRGRIGARVGSEFVQGDIRVEPSVTGFLYSVLTESGTSGAVNGITGVTGLREQGKLRGEVQASVNFFNLKTGLSGFVRADYRIGGDLVGGGGRVGVRYQW